MERAGAFVTQPHEYMGRVGPEKRTDFSGNFQRLIDLEPPDGLHIKGAVIKLSFGAVFAVNTLAFPKDLLTHSSHHFLYRTK